MKPEHLNSAETQRSAKANLEQLQSLTAKTDLQKMLQSRIVQQTENVGQSRLLSCSKSLGNSIPTPFLAVLAFWICMLFLGLGLLARFGRWTVTMALLVGSISVAGAILLVLEMSDPYSGLMQMSDQPLLNAMAQNGPLAPPTIRETVRRKPLAGRRGRVRSIKVNFAKKVI